MLEFAESELRLSAAQQDGKTLRWHLEHAAQQSGLRPKELDAGFLPAEMTHLWQYFLQLNAKRTSGGMALNPIADAQVLAWQQRHHIVLTPFESECIDALDDVFLANAGKQHGRGSGR